MTLTINDTRNKLKTVNRDDLKTGCIYVNPYGRYVIVADNDNTLDLETGQLVDIMDYEYEAVFIPVKAKLEVFA